MALMEAVAIIGLALSAIGTAYSVYSSEKAADEAERIADANARKAELEAEETARRAEKDAAREMSLAKAKAAASGITGLSTEVYLSDLEKTRREEIDWIRYSGSSQASIDKAVGASQARQARASGVAAIVKGGESSYTYGSNAGWW